jgi:carbon storage regulator
VLVLSRKEGEKIVINNGEIVITIVEIRGDKVRLGIEAPPDVDVHRQEVYEAIQRALEQGEVPPQEPPSEEG